MLDANFRAKSKNRGLSDFDIAPGWSYFVEEEKYIVYINAQGDQTEVMYLSSASGPLTQWDILTSWRPN